MRGRTPRLVTALGCAIAALVAVLLPGVAPARTTFAHPNILVVMTDDQTVENLRVMRNVKSLLVDRGATFDNFFTSFPLCCPSRATFLTGQYAHNTHVLGNDRANGLVNLDDRNTLPVWLSGAGYSTVFIGKYLNEYGSLASLLVPPGWSDWNAGVKLGFFNHTMNRNGTIVRYGSAERDYQSDVYTRIAVDAIEQHAHDRAPLFMWLSYFAPHYGGPRDPGDHNPIRATVPAPRHAGKFLDVPLPKDPSYDEADLSDKPAYIRDRPPISQAETDRMTLTYRRRLQSLLAVDEGVAKVVAALKRTGRLDDTLILFTSDNGYLQGEHRVRDGKELPYEQSIRVPLIVRGPGISAGLHLSQLTANIDLAPTILAAAHVKPGLVTDGRSLLPLIADPQTVWNRDILLERGPGGNTVGAPRLYTGVRTSRYVYVENSTGEKELYDLQTDPYELESKQNDPLYAPVLADLAKRLSLLRDCVGEGCRNDFG